MAGKRFHLHLVSDATGETVSTVARACVVQFRDVEAVPHQWWLVRSPSQIERVIAGIAAEPGIVLATVIDGEVRRALEDACRSLRVPFIPILDPVLTALTGYLGLTSLAEPGLQHSLNAEYFSRIDAMHFTLAHDDGQSLDDVNEADVILVGVSRTSKTPTCIYLANRGIKAANIPLVPGQEPPGQLAQAARPLIVGMTRDPKSLTEVRRNRLRFLDRDVPDYVDPDRVKDEVAHARRLFAERHWPVIDMTRRSIEEAAAAILQHLNERGARARETQAVGG